uniref:Potassium calcium-activated channel subfamily U member 1 n=1 Tax=Molossus molossus TaxID=27622 RepID=A0A7J8GKH7_MOLMO|nr:potassium calcium-activated channel subfamily U member 1 [Molossus molossus]
MAQSTFSWPQRTTGLFKRGATIYRRPVSPSQSFSPEIIKKPLGSSPTKDGARGQVPEPARRQGHLERRVWVNRPVWEEPIQRRWISSPMPLVTTQFFSIIFQLEMTPRESHTHSSLTLGFGKHTLSQHPEE